VVNDLEWIPTTLWQHADFTDNEIDSMEQKIHLWSVTWIALLGKEGMMNYTHCLTATAPTVGVRGYFWRTQLQNETFGTLDALLPLVDDKGDGNPKQNHNLWKYNSIIILIYNNYIIKLCRYF
jgi:hypothetical protein